MEYLGKRGMTSGDISSILAAADTLVAPEEAAEYILKERGDLWESMVSADAAKKIKASL